MVPMGPSACRRRRQREPRAALLEERKHRLQPGIVRRVPGGGRWVATTGVRRGRRTVPFFFGSCTLRCVPGARVESSHRVALAGADPPQDCGAQKSRVQTHAESWLVNNRRGRLRALWACARASCVCVGVVYLYIQSCSRRGALCSHRDSLTAPIGAQRVTLSTSSA